MPKQMKYENDQRGFGLVEVMIATAIISVLAIGITTLITDMFRMQKKASAVASITQMRSLIISAVQNGEAWARTSADAATGTGNPDMTCMLITGASECTAAVAPGYALNLKDPLGNPVFYSSAATNGFQPNGTLCTGYPSEACPFSWDLRWVPTCPGNAATCWTPSVAIIGTLEYFAGADPLPGGFNAQNYAINVLRGSEAIRNDPVIVVYRMGTDAGEYDDVPTTTCKNQWVGRKLNQVDQDSGNNLTNKSGSALSPLNQVTLRPGTYTCRVQVPGFKNGGNRIRVRATSGTMFSPILSSVAVASLNGGSVVNTIETTLVLNQATTFVVEHTCTMQPSDQSPLMPTQTQRFMFGVPTGDYGNVVYSSVACTRTS